MVESLWSIRKDRGKISDYMYYHTEYLASFAQRLKLRANHGQHLAIVV